jgi:cytochrome c oxidase subunit 2
MRRIFELLPAGSVAALLALGIFFAHVDARAAPQAKVIKIVAKRFAYTPGNITVKKGQLVVLELTSSDVVMGLNLPDFNVRGDMIPDKLTRVQFIADKTGTFTFVCDIFCGSGHEEMQGTITVVE